MYSTNSAQGPVAPRVNDLLAQAGVGMVSSTGPVTRHELASTGPPRAMLNSGGSSGSMMSPNTSKSQMASPGGYSTPQNAYARAPPSAGGNGNAPRQGAHYASPNNPQQRPQYDNSQQQQQQQPQHEETSSNGVMRYQPSQNIKQFAGIAQPARKTWEQQLAEEENEGEGGDVDDGYDADGKNIPERGVYLGNSADQVQKQNAKQLAQRRYNEVAAREDEVKSSMWYKVFVWNCAVVLLAGVFLLGLGVWNFYEFGATNWSVWFLHAVGLVTGLLAWAGFSGAYFKRLVRIMTYLFFMMFMLLAEVSFTIFLYASTSFQERTAHWIYAVYCVQSQGDSTESRADFCFCESIDGQVEAQLSCVKQWSSDRTTVLAGMLISSIIIQTVSIVCGLVIRERIMVQRKGMDEMQGGLIVGFLRASNIILAMGAMFVVGLGLSVVNPSWAILAVVGVAFILVILCAVGAAVFVYLKPNWVYRYSLMLGILFVMHIIFVAYFSSAPQLNDDTVDQVYNEHCVGNDRWAMSDIEAEYCRCPSYTVANPASARLCVEEWMTDRLFTISSVSNATAVLELACLWASILMRRKLLRVAIEKEIGESDDEGEVDDNDDL